MNRERKRDLPLTLQHGRLVFIGLVHALLITVIACASVHCVIETSILCGMTKSASAGAAAAGLGIIAGVLSLPLAIRLDYFLWRRWRSSVRPLWVKFLWLSIALCVLPAGWSILVIANNVRTFGSLGLQLCVKGFTESPRALGSIQFSDETRDSS
jgi:uncharacterized membrane protein